MQIVKCICSVAFEQAPHVLSELIVPLRVVGSVTLGAFNGEKKKTVPLRITFLGTVGVFGSRH